MNKKLGPFGLVGLLLCELMTPADAEDFELGLNRIGGAYANADWTIDKVFPGKKLIFEADYVFGRGAVTSPEPGVRDERLIGVMTSHFQWGKGETGLERYDISIAPIVRQRTYEVEPGRLQPKRDFWEWGAVRVDEDDPLGLDAYAEINFVRIGRAWQKRVAGRPITYTIDLHVSAGWAWASSFDDRYARVSNPNGGGWTSLAVEHDRWGRVYFSDRLMTGTSLGSPKESMSREALVRLGYKRRFGGCWRIDVFIEKRSFNFSDEFLPSLYTKGKRYGMFLECLLGDD